MKAIIYGPSGTVQLAEIEKPVPADDEVLVRVRAASINPLDASLVSSSPFARNLFFIMIGVRVKRPGIDIAGEVEAVGRKVTRFKQGDAVFGASAGGTFAEYACPGESRLAMKPANTGFNEAACMNIAGRTALQGIRDVGGVESGQSVLINGASGGIGTLAVQIARWLGANVTGVCSTQNLDLVRSLGAVHVIDYRSEDFTTSSDRYDVIFDLVGDKPLRTLKHILKPTGKWVGAGVLGKKASMIQILPGLLTPPLMSLFSANKFVSFMTKRDKESLPMLAELIETGHVKPVIDRTYPLAEAGEAISYVAARHARGKVVLTLG